MALKLNQRIQQLDILRAVAVFLVFGNHMTVCPPEVSVIFNKITSIWYRGGWIGVDLFFVLSGFLVSGLLFREYQKQGELNLKRFLIRRGFKIYPSFWILIVITCLVAMFFSVDYYRWGLLGELVFIQNYAGNLWAHTWTLAVEEHFYITLCIVFYLLLKFNKSSNPFSKIPRIFAFVAIVCLILRLMTAYFLPFQYEHFIEPTHLRMDSLFFGVFLSYLWYFKNLSSSKFLEKYRFPIGFLGFILLSPAFIWDLGTNLWMSNIGLTLFYFGSGCILLFALKSDFSKVPFASQTAYIGTFSYSIYLWNIPAQTWFSKAAISVTGIEGWGFYFFIYMMTTLLFGIGMAKIIEYPFLELRNKFVPSKIQPILQNAEA